MITTQQERLVTLGELVAFVLANRRGNAFKDYTEREIANSIYWSAEAKTLRYACNSDGKLVGIVTSFDDVEHSTLHIHDLLTTEPWVFKTFVRAFRSSYPLYKLTGLRYGTLTHYNPNQLIRIVLKGAK